MAAATSIVPGVVDAEWEVMGGRGGVRRGDVGDVVEGEKRVLIGLPARWCQTAAVRVPERVDAGMLGQAVRMKLEARGVIAADNADPLMAVNTIGNTGDGDTLVSVDVVTGDVGALRAKEGVDGFWCKLRGYDYPERTLVLMVEQGEVVAAVGREGKLLVAEVVSGVEHWGEASGRELQAMVMGLEAEGLVEGIDRAEWWGGREDVDEEEIHDALGWLPVSLQPHPACRVPTGGGLMLLPEVSVRRAKRRRRTLAVAAVLAAVVGYAVLVTGLRSKMLRLEQEAATLAKRVEETAGPAEKVKAIGGRWASFKFLTDPRRYPLVQLENLARAMPEGGILLEGFQSKGREVTVTCEARDTQAAYEFFGNVTASDDLKVMSWSMERPRIDWEGAADFTLKGKAR